MQGNHKSKTYKDTHTHTHTHTKKERTWNITPKIVIKYQEKRAKEKKNQKNLKIIFKKQSGISTYLSIITLNINEIGAIKKWNFVIWNNMGGYRGYYAKWNVR